MSAAATLATGLAIVTLVTIALLIPLLLLGALNAALTRRRARRREPAHTASEYESVAHHYRNRDAA